MITHLAAPEDTLAFGESLAAHLKAGDVIALCGQLGVGKTHVVKGLLTGLDSSEEVTSPTFSLVHEYQHARLPVFHFDFYRMKHEADLLNIGWDEYLDEPGIVIVEWADLFPALLPPHTQWFRLEALPEGGRRVTRTA
ncbi:MAG: tRNA (adenosine(37)-N6)-threonylcarbamoyltransferase complex ATPase subunit type 1 TsaE [Verrucomicrobiaceae bacterium]|jgi:tRNA threonylcarbamoyladenosine biosynthesis protein TsaE